MIYPPQFPLGNNNEYEKEVYFALSKLMDVQNPENDIYDVFCFRKFAGEVTGERIEYEIDFIVANKRRDRFKGLLILEVKGRYLRYNGTSSIWTQDGRDMNQSPTTQATRNMRSLMARFDFISRDMAIGWAVWFPKMVNPGKEELPPELTEEKFFDEISLSYTKEKLEAYFDRLYEQWPNKRGARFDDFHRLKEPLIRDFGFALPLHKKIEAAEVRYIQMTNRQLDLLRNIGENKDILVSGPAGSGKTIMATTIARELSESGEKVLILAFNRTLTNNIRYGLGRPDNPEVSTYHSLARKYIDQIDDQWWGQNSQEENFWSLEVPAKLVEVLDEMEPEYDSIIIDEAQDLQELWFESLNRLVKPEGGYYIFMDEDQDIFNAFTTIPLNRKLWNFKLKENCRNSVEIINLLKGYVNKEIEYKPDAVTGEPVKIIEYKNDTEQMNLIKKEWLSLVEEKNISPGQIILMMNADMKTSCLRDTKKFGRFKIESLNRSTGQLHHNKVNYTSIRIFKGLEADIVFIIDTDKVKNTDYRVLYTQASRANYLLTIFKLK